MIVKYFVAAPAPSREYCAQWHITFREDAEFADIWPSQSSCFSPTHLTRHPSCHEPPGAVVDKFWNEFNVRSNSVSLAELATSGASSPFVDEISRFWFEIGQCGASLANVGSKICQCSANAADSRKTSANLK